MFLLKSSPVFRPLKTFRRGLWERSKHLLPTFMASAIGVSHSIGGGLLVSQWEDRVAMMGTRRHGNDCASHWYWPD
jgi:hypothetical protein